jgi:RHS repeat-associated protein
MSAQMAMAQQPAPRKPRFGLGRLAVLAAVLLGMAALGAGRAQATTSITQTTAWTYNSTTALVTSETLHSKATSPSTCISSAGDNTCSVTTTYTRDAYGNITGTAVTGTSLPAALNEQGSSISGRTTTTTYDSQGEFAIQTTNGVGQSDSWTYNAGYGEPLTHTAPDGLVTQWAYDSLGRKTSENRPDGTSTAWGYFYGQYGNPLGAYVIQTDPWGLSGGSWVQTAPQTNVAYDKLGRVIYKLAQAYNGTTLSNVVEFTNYDANGNVTSADGIPVWTSNPTIYTYDALGRVLTAKKPYGTTGSTTTYSYNGLTTTVTDAQSRVTTTTDNDVGLPISVKNAAGSTTTYAYDALGDRTQITDPASHVTTYTYDVEGRKTKTVDPDRGTWTYAYDALGNLISQTDAKSQVTTLTYDVLGEILSRTQPNQTDIWVYDTEGRGILSEEAQNGGGTPFFGRTWFCDADARPTKTANSGIYGTSGTGSGDTTTTYDFGSRISTITYPSGYVVTYSYNTIGNLSSVAGTPVGSSSSQTLWTLNTSSSSGQVTKETLGNGVVVSNTYDPNTALLTGTVAGLSSGSQTGDASTANVANLTYTYDNLGNLTGRSDADADTPNITTAPTNLSETFGYDNLYRVTSENLPASVTKTLSYDALGDLTYKSDTGTYSYATSGHVHAVSSIAGVTGSSYDLTTSYTYDADGNHLTGDGYTATWTSFNMPLSATRGSTTVSYVYDADHNRIAQTTPQGVTTYFFDPISGVRSEEFEASGGVNTWTDYIFAGSEPIGIHVTPATGNAYNRFFIRDQLGSIAVLTGDIGCSGLTLGGTNSCLAERDSYDAWGKRRNPINWADDVNNTVASTTTRGFTDQEMVQNTSSGYELINMNARMYDPTTGKFMATDPQIQDAGNLQGLNAYAYVTNNPLSFTDPTGMEFTDVNGNYSSGDSSSGDGGGGTGGAGGGGASTGSGGGVNSGTIAEIISGGGSYTYPDGTTINGADGSVTDGYGNPISGAESGYVGGEDISVGADGSVKISTTTSVTSVATSDSSAANSGVQVAQVVPPNNAADTGAQIESDLGITNLQLLHGPETLQSNASTINHYTAQGIDATIESLFNGPEPLLVNQQGTILNGNSRVQALQNMGVSPNELIPRLGPSNIYIPETDMFLEP